jgi:hypothetical protein
VGTEEDDGDMVLVLGRRYNERKSWWTQSIKRRLRVHAEDGD